jgi:hypothetical protein
MSSPPLAGRWPRWLAPAAVALGALLLASLARYRLVEPAELTVLCAALPWDSPACVLRSLTVQAFADQRLGLAAVTLALLAVATRWRAVALLALAVAGAGLVLYSTRWAAPAVLLAALALLPPVAATGVAR